MKPKTIWPRLAEEVGRLIRSIIANEAAGQPLVTSEVVSFARRWLERILIDSVSLIHHLQLLQEAFGNAFPFPKRRRDSWECETPTGPAESFGFPHWQLLPEETALGIVERGLSALDDPDAPDMGALLLNPFALCELADLIDCRLPDAWLEALAEAGKEACAEQPHPRSRQQVREELVAVGGTMGARTDCCVLTDPGKETSPLRQRIADHLYGNPDCCFALRLSWAPAPGTPDQVQPVLEISPVPTRDHLSVQVVFPTGDRRLFDLPVPTRESMTLAREWASSEPCFPLPLTAMLFEEQIEWSATAWPPELRLRS